jgi:hypothetical protein
MEVNVQLHAPVALNQRKELQVQSELEAGRARGPDKMAEIKQESFVPARNRIVRWSGQYHSRHMNYATPDILGVRNLAATNFMVYKFLRT